MATRLVTKQGLDRCFRLALIFVTFIFLTACGSSQPTNEKAIVGKWENPQGGVIQFYEDKTGFIPGDDQQAPPIPSASFTYSFPDQTHLAITMAGQESVVFEIELDDDTMTWHSSANTTQFVYTRAK
ncbi:MAG: hypothetical protein U0175_19435 [Caldilineaceae bacterium]